MLIDLAKIAINSSIAITLLNKEEYAGHQQALIGVWPEARPYEVVALIQSYPTGFSS